MQLGKLKRAFEENNRIKIENELLRQENYKMKSTINSIDQIDSYLQYIIHQHEEAILTGLQKENLKSVDIVTTVKFTGDENDGDDGTLLVRYCVEVYASSQASQKKEIFSIVVDEHGDGCFASKRAVDRRNALLVLTRQVAQYVKTYLESEICINPGLIKLSNNYPKGLFEYPIETICARCGRTTRAMPEEIEKGNILCSNCSFDDLEKEKKEAPNESKLP